MNCTKEKLMNLIVSDLPEKDQLANAEAASVLADHLIANGVTVQEWISVEERLPEERKSVVPALGSYSMPVLVVWERKCTGDRFVREGYTREGVFVNKTYNDEIRATHWMPLPEPPKGE